MIDDPIVREIHDVRQRLWEECGRDLDRYLARLKAAELQHEGRLVTVEDVEKRSRAASEPSTTADPKR
jgi:hypothetical protein